MTAAENRFLRSEDGSRQYKYFAFISYKHYDMLWGMWLQWQLEGYRLPTHLCDNEERPQRLTPIFRDGTDLTSGGTTDELLLEKLRQSKYLIVICSKNMQRDPYWINREIEHFLEMGNPISHIIPFVVNGQGCAKDPRQEAFPPALLAMGDKIPHGITVSPLRLHDAILKLVAAIHGLDIQSIRTHDQVRRQRNRAIALGLGMAASLGLAAFMAWEVLSVKQAQLREQNVYAANVFSTGDRRLAQAMSQNILEHVTSLMEEAISEDAAQTRYLASVEPLLSPVTLLETAFSNTTACFTCAGDRILIYTDEQIHIYDLEGGLLHSCSVSALGQKFVTVSPDGEYAVSLSVFENYRPYVELWLCSVPEQTRLVKLVEVHADQVSENEASAGQFQTVVDAVFSDDGKLVAAYRTEGYYNSSELLQVYSLETRQPVVSLDAALLGSNGQGFVIQDFEFLSDTRFHWTGPLYHVIYDAQTQETWQVPLRDVTTSGRGQEAYGYLRAMPRQEGTSSYVLLKNLATGRKEELFFENAVVAKEDCQFFGGKYAMLTARTAEDAISQILIVDMDKLLPVQRISLPTASSFAHVSALTAADSVDYYLYVYNDRTCGLLWIDPVENTIVEIPVPDTITPTPEFRFVGTSGGADWLLGQSVALRIADHTATAFALAEQNTAFVQTADLSGAAEMLISVHNDSFALYPLTNPGLQVDTGLQWQDTQEDVLLATSGDGNTLAKAQGNQFGLFVGERCVLSGSTASAVQAVSITAAGDRFLCADAQTLYLYRSDGTLLDTCTLDADARIWDACFIPDGSRIVLAAIDANWSYPSAELRLLDGATLEEIQSLCEAYRPTGASRDLIDGVYRENRPEFTVSADSRHIAAVNLIYSYYNSDGSLKMRPQYQRVISVYSTQDGALVARGPIQGEAAALLDMGENLSQATGFRWLRFAQSGNLLAAFSSGLWVIDPENYSTRFVAASAQAATAPEQNASGLLFYPGDGLGLIDAETGSLVSTFAVQGGCEIQLSTDGSWITVTDSTGTWILSTSDISTYSKLANQPVEVVYLDQCQIIYNCDNGLYRIPIPQ